MRLSLIIVFSLGINHCLGQETEGPQPIGTTPVISPYNPDGDYNNFGLKCFLIPAPIGNSAVLLLTGGVEYGFHKNHSIGIDADLFYEFGSHDEVKDTAGVSHDVGDNYHVANRALLFNYRYYFYMERVREKDHCSPYVSCFYRYGLVSGYIDQLYHSDIVSRKEIDNSIGLLVGGLWKFKKHKQFGLDVNIGCSRKWRRIETAFKEDNVVKSKVEKPIDFVPRIGFNLYWWFYR